MKASIRAALMTGVAALSVGALGVTAMAPPESMQTIEVQRPVNFAADTLPIDPGAPVELPPSDDELNSALALLEQLAPVTDGRAVTVTLRSHEHPGTVTVASAVPNATAKADGGSGDIAGLEAPDEPVPLNAASDVIDSVYSISRYWANYVSLELGPWLINWIPFGYLVSDQIYIWYPDFVLPTVDSFVYDFLDPVVNNPLNLEVWIDGIGDVINTAANGFANGFANEINYIVTFGWFPIPLPPLPGFPLPGLGSASAAASTSAVALTFIEAGETATDAPEGATAKRTEEVATEPVDTDTTDEVTEEDAADEDATEAPAQERTQEEVGDDTEAPAKDQPEDSETPVEAVDGSAEKTIGESSTEPSDEAQEALHGTADAPDSANESGAADQSGDEDASKGTPQDTASGSGEKSVDNDSGGLGASGSEH